MTEKVDFLNKNDVPARSFSRLLSLIVAIEKIEKPDLKKITDDTGIPDRSIHAMLDKLHKEYFMVIERVQGRRFGYYRISDWGAINKDWVMQQSTLPDDNSISSKFDVT